MQYRRCADSHMITNAHPIYGEAAYAMGCINEPPPTEPPNLEVRLLQVASLF